MVECLSTIKKLLKKIDYFATIITFKINEEIEYKSLIGGILTIFYAIFLTTFILLLIIQFLKEGNINFIYSNKIKYKNPFINLTELGFQIGFGVQYYLNSYPAINDTKLYFNYNISLIEWTGKDNITEYQLEYNLCNVSDFSTLTEQFYLNDLEQMLCPIYDIFTNFSIDGLYTDDYYKYISIIISLTDYSLHNFNELENFLNSFPIEVIIFFKDTGIDYENREHPLPSYLNYNKKIIDLNSFKTTEILISSLEFVSDENIIINNPKMTKKLIFQTSYDSFEIIKNRNENNQNILFEYIIGVSPKIIYLKRTYGKIPELLANITGVLNFFLFLFSTFATIIERIAINQKLIQRILKYKGNKHINVNYFIKKFNCKDIIIEKNKINIKECYDKDNSLLNNTDLNTDDNLKKNNINQNEDEKINERLSHKIMKKSKKNYLDKNKVNISKHKNNISSLKSGNILYKKNKKHKRIKATDLETKDFETNDMINIKDNIRVKQSINSKILQENISNYNLFNVILISLCKCFPKLNQKHKIIKIIEKKINYYMDIITYLKIIQEFELLKEILFNEKYLKLFEFVSKPSLKIKKDELIFCQNYESEFIPFKKIDKKEIDELYLNYKKILKQEKSIEKLKLVNLFKQEINFLLN